MPKAKKKLFFHWENAGHLSETTKNEIRQKTKGRAKRHWKGDNIHHRVVNKSDTEITFAFFRRTGNRVTIRWRREAKAADSAVVLPA